jgi:hypothetical protein
MRSSNKDLPTLLHYIAVKGEKEFPEVIEMVKDFEALPLACKGKLPASSCGLSSPHSPRMY